MIFFWLNSNQVSPTLKKELLFCIYLQVVYVYIAIHFECTREAEDVKHEIKVLASYETTVILICFTSADFELSLNDFFWEQMSQTRSYWKIKQNVPDSKMQESKSTLQRQRARRDCSHKILPVVPISDILRLNLKPITYYSMTPARNKQDLPVLLHCTELHVRSTLLTCYLSLWYPPTPFSVILSPEKSSVNLHTVYVPK